MKQNNYEDFSRLLFYHTHREASALANEIPEESGLFRFLRTTCLTNLKGSVDLTWPKVSLNGHLNYPNDIDKSLNESASDKIRKYHADYNNNPPNARMNEF